MQVKEQEGERILAGVKPGFLTIALDPRAPLIASEEIAALLGEAELSGENIFYYWRAAWPVADGSCGCGSEGVVFPADIYAYNDPADFI